MINTILNVLIEGSMYLLLWIVTTALTGSVLYGIWYVLQRIFEKRHVEQTLYYLLKVVTGLYLMPILLTVLFLVNYDFNDHSNTIVFLDQSNRIRVLVLILLGIWLLGFLKKLFSWIKSYQLVKAIRSTCELVCDCIQTQADLLGKRLGMKKRIPVLCGEEINVPCVMGVRYPKIYLQDTPESRYTQEQLENCLIHELQHCRHHDLRIQALIQLVCCVHWFCPVIAVLQKSSKLWNEYYTDYTVWMYLQDKKSYILTLLNIALAKQAGIYREAVMLCDSKSVLQKRIERIEDMKKGTKRMTGAAVFFTAIFLFGSTMLVSAAGIGIADGYGMVYDNTAVEIEEDSQMAETEYVEYTEAADEGAAVIVEEDADDGIDLQSTIVTFSWTIKDGVRRQTTAFAKSKGSSIQIITGITPSTKIVKAGIIDSSGTKRYVSGKGTINYTFAINTAGKYRVFIQNGSGVTVTAEGYYKK